MAKRVTQIDIEKVQEKIHLGTRVALSKGPREKRFLTIFSHEQ